MSKRYCAECKKETEHSIYGQGFLCANYGEHGKHKLKRETILKGVILTELGNVNILKGLTTLGSIIYDLAYKYHNKKADTQNVINAQIALKELGVDVCDIACSLDFEWPKEKQDTLRLAIDKMVDESETVSPDNLSAVFTDRNGKKTTITVPMESATIKVLSLNKHGIAYLKRLRGLGFRF